MITTNTADGARADNVNGGHGRHETARLDMLVKKTALDAVDGQVDVVVGDWRGGVQVDQRRQFLEEQVGRGFEGDGTGHAGLGRDGVKGVGINDSFLVFELSFTVSDDAVRTTTSSAMG